MVGADVLILGCGYTGVRLAHRLLDHGARVTATTRDSQRQEALTRRGARVEALDIVDTDSIRRLRSLMAPDVIIIHSMPPIRQGATLIEPTPSIIDAVGNAPAHMIYLSSTGVYGATVRVDEETPVAPCTETQHCRVAAERLVLAGPWPALALRLAAIYGPQRGMHASMRTGRYRIVDDGLNYVSHIHVDDLVTHIIAGIEMRLTGVFPVADEQPAQTVAVAALCANLLNLPLPPRITRSQAHETQQFSRRVDGAAIRRLLGLSLRFPTYHSGIPAAIAASHSDALQTAIGS